MPEVLFQTYIYRLVNKLVAKTLPWSQKRNAKEVVAFAAFNHFQQEVHMKRTKNPTLTAGRYSSSIRRSLQRFGRIPLEKEWVKFCEFMKTCMREERERELLLDLAVPLEII